MTKAELQERKNTLATEMRAMGDRFHAQDKKWKDDAERAAFEKLNTDYETAKRELDQVVEAEAVAKRMSDLTEEESRSANPPGTLPGREDTRHQTPPGGDGTAGPSEEIRQAALRAYFRASLDLALNERDEDALRQCRIRAGGGLRFALHPTEIVQGWSRHCRSVHPSMAIADLADPFSQRARLEARALGTYTQAGGGVLVPTTLIRAIEINMLAFGGMRQVAETIVTQNGGEMGWPTGDDTGNEGQQLGESQAQPSEVDPAFRKVIWRDYKFTSTPIKVDQELLEDSQIDLATIIGQMCGERVGRITNRKQTLGTGNGTCRGIVPASPVGRTTSGAITFDDVMMLEHSVDPAYRNGAGYMCHDTILLTLKLLKDSVTGQYLWQNGIDIGKPDTLNRRPLTINQHMADTTTLGDDVLLFGQLSKYKIRRVREARFYRLGELHACLQPVSRFPVAPPASGRCEVCCAHSWPAGRAIDSARLLIPTLTQGPHDATLLPDRPDPDFSRRDPRGPPAARTGEL